MYWDSKGRLVRAQSKRWTVRKFRKDALGCKNPVSCSCCRASGSCGDRLLQRVGSTRKRRERLGGWSCWTCCSQEDLIVMGEDVLVVVVVVVVVGVFWLDLGCAPASELLWLLPAPPMAIIRATASVDRGANSEVDDDDDDE